MNQHNYDNGMIRPAKGFFSKARVQELVCPKGKSRQVESGGFRGAKSRETVWLWLSLGFSTSNRARQLRTLNAIEERPVKKVPCANCKKHLKSLLRGQVGMPRKFMQ